MYITKIIVKESNIEGKGVFALENIKKGTVVWKFDPNHDQTMSPEKFEKLDTETKELLKRVAYFSETSSRWVYPPEGDPSNFTNHSENNNLTSMVDLAISEEPFFIASRDIGEGEELAVNYLEFDLRKDEEVLDWK